MVSLITSTPLKSRFYGVYVRIWRAFSGVYVSFRRTFSAHVFGARFLYSGVCVSFFPSTFKAPPFYLVTWGPVKEIKSSFL